MTIRQLSEQIESTLAVQGHMTAVQLATQLQEPVEHVFAALVHLDGEGRPYVENRSPKAFSQQAGSRARLWSLGTKELA